jgi:hypothetical protein
VTRRVPSCWKRHTHDQRKAIATAEAAADLLARFGVPPLRISLYAFELARLANVVYVASPARRREAVATHR